MSKCKECGDEVAELYAHWRTNHKQQLARIQGWAKYTMESQIEQTARHMELPVTKKMLEYKEPED